MKSLGTRVATKAEVDKIARDIQKRNEAFTKKIGGYKSPKVKW